MSGLLSIAFAPLASMLLASATPPAGATFEVPFQHKLSTAFGALPFMEAVLSWDPEQREMYVTGDGSARVFNENGMEVYTFAEDPQVGTISRIAAIEGGDLLAQVYREGRLALVRLNYRGEFIREITPSGVPAGYESAVRQGFMRYQGGRIYLADRGAMRVVVLDLAGACVASWDLAEKIGESDNRADLGVRGFNVDLQGEILFTVQPLFRAFVLSPEGEIRSFGVKGSAPGKFNVVSGIARDDAGNFYVADILKSAVLVFDGELRFVREFGYRGGGEGSLAAPDDLAVGADKLYVSQHARRGVSVFRIAQQ
jgi:DNA-binding beta-propeller fold protein YncE